MYGMETSNIQLDEFNSILLNDIKLMLQRDKHSIDNLTNYDSLITNICKGNTTEFQVFRTVEFKTRTLTKPELVGFIHYLTVKNSFLCIESDKITYIKALIIKQNERRNGHGTFLLQSMLRDIDPQVNEVHVRIAHDNKAAQKLFERNNFKHCAYNGNYNDYCLRIEN